MSVHKKLPDRDLGGDDTGRSKRGFVKATAAAALLFSLIAHLLWLPSTYVSIPNLVIFLSIYRLYHYLGFNSE